MAQQLQLTAPDAAAYDRLGAALAGAGELNADGYDDVILGVSGRDDGADDAGAAYVFFGSAAGLDASTELKLVAPAPEPDDLFGDAVAGAGDINGDGYADLLIGSTGDRSADGAEAGAAWTVFGSAAGLDLGSMTRLTALSGGADLDDYGAAVAGAGDVNGDGYADLIVGARSADGAEGGYAAGTAYVYLGGPGGASSASEVQLFASNGDSEDLFGGAVSGAGDLDGDGFDEVIVGSNSGPNGNNAGAAYVYSGSSQGTDSGSELRIRPSDAQVSHFFAAAVSGAGDVNADGYDDLIVGATGDSGRVGAAYVFFGSSAGADRSLEAKIVASDGATNDHLGGSVSGAGDVDGDGYADVIIGSRGDDDFYYDSGSAYLYAGGSAGVDLSSELKLNGADSVGGDNLGVAVAGVGDVDGDGLGDLLIGADYADVAGEYAGTAYLFAACAGGSTWYVDLDVDGYGVSEGSVSACLRPVGYAHQADDCDDSDHFVNAQRTWYVDADADGWGDEASGAAACVQPADTIPEGGDCDDADADVHPGASEVRGDGVDSDCDGSGGPDDDDDGDGLSWSEEQALGTSDADADSDSDGLSDGDELSLGTDPTDEDSDDDGVSDGDEVAAGRDPLVAESEPDPDTDSGSDPDSGPDTQPEPEAKWSCAAHAGGAGGGWSALAALLALGMRRRRRARCSA